MNDCKLIGWRTIKDPSLGIRRKQSVLEIYDRCYWRRWCSSSLKCEDIVPYIHVVGIVDEYVYLIINESHSF